MIVVRNCVVTLELFAVIHFRSAVNIIVCHRIVAVDGHYFFMFVLGDHVNPGIDNLTFFRHLVHRSCGCAGWKVNHVVHTLLLWHRAGVVIYVIVFGVDYSEIVVIDIY